ncbi:hypothetical protein B9N66_01780 [Campylobacter concisus]|uniref:hypothetical protein n=1 Tax=Campylobacter concisus TaxID=199 RepID=UPI000B3D58BE|nr:hypothetical protein [Campylobacter concisus]OUT10125.1 hypothetical protein B9N66_01780 [Campylobacter concisus]
MDLDNFKHQDENEILKEIKEKELSEDEISSLINLGKKDILIALAREQKLSSAQIKDMLPNAPYMVVCLLVEKQDISEVKAEILEKIEPHAELYKELIAKYKGVKW